MTFFIVLFIVLMQFLWRYIDDLVGKGLEIKVIAELMGYAAVCMVPQALPLAILLASLMTFGNLGEKSELTAMKASGISLFKTMMPLIVLVSGVAVGAFFFQNDVLPKAQVKMWTLLFSMKQKSPELEIPEKAFYDQIPGYSIYVDSKNADTGVLRGVMIYDLSKGFGNSTVLRADSGRLAFTKDQSHLYLKMWHGEQFDNMQGGTAVATSNTQNFPFRRETFKDKEIFIKFDNGFNRLDEEGMRKQYVGKNIEQLQHTIDSVEHRIDSVGTRYSRQLRATAYGGVEPEMDKTGNPLPLKQVKRDAGSTESLPALISVLGASERQNMYNRAAMAAKQAKMDLQFKIESMKDDNLVLRRHQIELMKKFTLSVACLLFFFIGAPLGAIIRKGGLGTPLVVSVIIFIVYYIIDNTGYKLARDGKWIVWQGMWISTFILAPLGVYVTYKAMNDSAVFNADAWRRAVTRILGVKLSRKVEFKELIMHPMSLAEARGRMGSQLDEVRSLSKECGKPQLWVSYWWKGFDNKAIRAFGMQLDDNCLEMTNCKDLAVVNKLLDFPVVRGQWLYQPSASWKSGVLAMALFPLSVPVWIVGMVKQNYLRKDLKKIEVTTKAELSLIDSAIARESTRADDESLSEQDI